MKTNNKLSAYILRGSTGAVLFSCVIVALCSAIHLPEQPAKALPPQDGAGATPTPTCAPPPPNLVSWWPGDGNADDIVGSNNGILRNGATFAPGMVDQAFSFDGMDDYVEVPNSPSLNPTTLTVDAWINPLDVSGNHDVVFKGDHEYLLQIRNGNVLFGSKNSAGNYAEFQGSLSVQANTWTHVAITHDGSTKRIYVNGVLDPNTQNQSGLYTGETGPLRIGTHFFLIEYFSGLIDEVDIFSRALSQQEIQAIYNAGSAGKCRSPTPTPTPCAAPSDMAAWWKFEETTGTIAHDEVGGNDGTYIGSPVPVTGRVGNARSFDRVDDVVSLVSRPVAVQGNAARSIFTWVKTTYDGWQAVVATGTPAFNEAFNLVVGYGGYSGVVGVMGFNTDFYPSSGRRVDDGAWHLIGATYDGAGTLRTYVDGNLDNSGSMTYATSGQNNYIAQSNHLGGHEERFLGDIDEVMIFDRAVTPCEVAAMYAICVPPPPNMVSWWPGDGNTDDIIDGNNGAFVGNASYSTGEVGQALSLDGSSYVEVPDAANLDFAPNAPITIDMWVYRISAAPVMHIIGKRVACGSSINYQMALNVTSGKGLSWGGGGFGVVTGQDLPLNTWTHLAGTFDGSTYQFYINGELAGTATGTLGSPNNAPLQIGNSGDCGSFGGLIDEVELFNRALSQAEIQAIYNAGSAGKCKGTPTPTPTATATATVTATATATATPTATITPSPTPTPSLTPRATPTARPRSTPAPRP